MNNSHTEAPLPGRRDFPRAVAALMRAVAALMVVAAVAGCSDSSETSTSETAVKDADVAAAEARLADHYRGNEVSPPTIGPPPQQGNKVWVISCGQFVSSCAKPTQYTVDAIKLIGWKPTVFDGKLDPSQFAAGIRQATSADADGIILISVDCSLVTAPLREARAAGIEVVGNLSLDCNEPAVDTGPPLYAAPVPLLAQAPTVTEFLSQWGAAKADWVAVQTKGHARVIEFELVGFPIGAVSTKGFEQGLAKCSDCKVVEKVLFAGTDYGANLQQKTEQAILKHPEANALVVSFDGDITGGVGAGIQASGQGERLSVVGGEGYPENLELLKQGDVQDAITAWNQEWTAWTTVDVLNRVFEGEEPVAQGNGWYILDREHNLPSGTAVPSKVDFKAAYQGAWHLNP